MASNTTDLTFRIDRTGNMVPGKRGEYVANIVTLLFNMTPGFDEYEPEKGLAISTKYAQSYVDKTRDTEFENRIVEQFTRYTDLIPVNVIAMYMNESLHIYMAIQFEGTIYELDATAANDTLTAVLRQQ